MKPSKKFPIFILPLLLLAADSWSQTLQTTFDPVKGGESLGTILSDLLLGAGALLSVAAITYLLKVNQFLYKKLLPFEAVRHSVLLPVEPERRIIHNRLSPRWMNIFVATIVGGIGYMYFYHWKSDDPAAEAKPKTAVATIENETAAALVAKADMIDESNVKIVTDAGSISAGQAIYKNLCVACHGQNGEGNVGPNFTDKYWMHGGGIQNVFKAIKYGVPEKGMISWQPQLTPVDMQNVASYILTLKGTKPANPKAPQGEIWKGADAGRQKTTGQEISMKE